MTNKAFTLIEFLVALVIIGFIVAILVGVFSNPVKQAALDAQVTTAVDATNAALAAVQLYEARTGNSFHALAGDKLNTLVDLGYLTAQPMIDAASTLAGTTNERIFYESTNEAAGAAACAAAAGAWAGTCWGDPDLSDDYLYTVNTKCGDFCREFNKRYGNPEEIPLPGDGTRGIQCTYDTDPDVDGNCYIMAPYGIH